MDGITPEQLEPTKAKGWAGIEGVQSYEESMQTGDNPDDAVPQFDVTARYSHLGTCPDCQKDPRSAPNKPTLCPLSRGILVAL
jgi:hypothetical protein